MHARRWFLWKAAAFLTLGSVWFGAMRACAEALDATHVERGRQLFTHVWRSNDDESPKGDGLGSLHNADSCAACHEQGGVGGAGPNSLNVQLLTFTGTSSRAPGNKPALLPARLKKFHPEFLAGNAVHSTIVLHRQSTEPEYRLWRDDVLSRATSAGAESGNPLVALVSLAVFSPSRSPTRGPRVRTLEVDNLRYEVSERNTPALFGAGLINSVTEKMLADGARQQARQYPGITGRVPRSSDGRVGRFGWRGQVSTLQDFVQNACAVELGLQLRNRRQAESPIAAVVTSPTDSKRSSALSQIDLAPEQVTNLVAYVASLPKPNEIDPPRFDNDTLDLPHEIGESVFISVGCAACHPRNLGTIDAVFSDLLLHDMGPELSDSSPAIPVQSRTPIQSNGYGGGSVVSRSTTSPSLAELRREWRTPPLWGVRNSAPYLHDGRAETLEAAILAHAGEAADAAQRFRARPPPFQQKSVIEFLKTLAAP